MRSSELINKLRVLSILFGVSLEDMESIPYNYDYQMVVFDWEGHRLLVVVDWNGAEVRRNGDKNQRMTLVANSLEELKAKIERWLDRYVGEE